MQAPIIEDGCLFLRPIKGGAIIGFLIGTIVGFAIGGIGGAILFAIIGTIGGAIAAGTLWVLGGLLFEAAPFLTVLLVAGLVLGSVATVIYLLWGVDKPH